MCFEFCSAVRLMLRVPSFPVSSLFQKSMIVQSPKSTLILYYVTGMWILCKSNECFGAVKEIGRTLFCFEESLSPTQRLLIIAQLIKRHRARTIISVPRVKLHFDVPNMLMKNETQIIALLQRQNVPTSKYQLDNFPWGYWYHLNWHQLV